MHYLILYLPFSAGRPGGGICVIFRKGFKLQVNSVIELTFEYMDITLESRNNFLRIFAIYRPPPSKKNKLKDTLFHDESLSTKPSKLPILGDFNIRVDNPDEYDTCKFLDLLSSANLYQMVFGPIHKKGHTWDLVISSII